MNELNHVLEILKAELRYVDKDTEYNKAVYNTLQHVIEIIEAHIGALK